MDFLMIAGLANVLSAAVGYVIGYRMGRPAAGILWALLLGPLGWLVMLAAGDARPRCPSKRRCWTIPASCCP
jgi:hypothetical protein